MEKITEQIIRSLSRDEVRELRFLLQRRGNKNGEDIRMIDHIRGYRSAEKNVNADHQTRKRLRRHLEQFALLENSRKHILSAIHADLEMARFLFDRNMHKPAWKYLLRAEEKATDIAEYNLLDTVYYIQISYLSQVYTSNKYVPDRKELLLKRKQNLSLARLDSDANAAYTHLIHEITQVSSKGWIADMEALVQKVLTLYNLKEQIYQQPRIYIRIVDIVCRALRDNNDDQRLKEYAMNSYAVMRKRRMLSKIPAALIMELMLSLCASTLRTRDYRNNEKFALLYEEYAQQFRHQKDKFIYHDFMSGLIKADLFISTNRLAEAKNILQELNRKYRLNTEILKIFLMLRVNLVHLHFIQSDYRACIRTINEMMQTNQQSLLKLGRIELMIYTDLYTAIAHYESDDTDHAYYLLGKIRKKYAAQLGKTEYTREKSFIRIFSKICNSSAYLHSRQFRSDSDRFVKMKKYIPGDREYISLNAWLLSKVDNTGYYTCFLKLVSG